MFVGQISGDRKCSRCPQMPQWSTSLSHNLWEYSEFAVMPWGNQHTVSHMKLGRKRGVDMNTVIYQQDGTLPHCSDRSLEFLGRYFPGVDSFRVALTSLGHPTPLTWTHATTSFGGASRKGSMTTIPRPWQIWRTTSERRSGGYQMTW